MYYIILTDSKGIVRLMNALKFDCMIFSHLTICHLCALFMHIFSLDFGLTEWYYFNAKEQLFFYWFIDWFKSAYSLSLYKRILQSMKPWNLCLYNSILAQYQRVTICELSRASSIDYLWLIQHFFTNFITFRWGHVHV